jgi:hypothetical protein
MIDLVGAATLLVTRVSSSVSRKEPVTPTPISVMP